MAPDDFALVAHLLDTWTDLHGLFFFQTGGWYELLVAIGNAATGEVVRRDLDLDLVAREDANAMHPHFPRGVGQYLVAILELNAEHGVRQRFSDRSLQHDGVFLRLRQVTLSSTRSSRGGTHATELQGSGDLSEERRAGRACHTTRVREERQPGGCPGDFDPITQG